MTAALDHDIEAEDADDVVERSAGQIVSVTAAPVAASLVADATAGATLLEVDDAAIFDEIAGGTVQLGGNTYTYQGAGIDTAADTVTVDTGLAADASEGDQVTAWDDANNDAYRIWEADVAVPGAQDNDEPVAAVVSQSLTVQIAQGTRDITPGETITMELTGTTWTIIDAPGSKSQVQPDAGGQNVVTGDSSGSNSTSITSTLTGTGNSRATGDSNLVAGDGAAADDAPLDAVVLGPNALINLSGNRGTVVGPGGYVNIDYGATLGANATVKGYSGLGAGSGSFVEPGADYGSAVGPNTLVGVAGGGAFGCDSTGTGASPDLDNELAIGTPNHIAVIKGKLVIADGSGGLHQMVVSTGGALSTVAYP